MVERIKIDTSELGDVIDDLTALNKNIQINSRKFGALAARNLINRIERNIERIFDGHGRRKEQQVKLKNSFSLQAGTNKQRIRSNAPHALPLEEGSTNHEIEAGGGAKNADALTIPTTDVPSSELAKGEGDDVYILRNKVHNHPGNMAYRYILISQTLWNEQYVETKLPREMRRAITKSGFKPEGI